jgi:hypothetical protein
MRDKFKRLYSETSLNQKAKSCGFVKRKSIFTPLMFFDVLITGSVQDTHMSLERNCEHIAAQYGVQIKKQSLDERYNSSALAFIKSLIEEQLQSQIIQEGTDFLKWFGRVIISDSTRFDVPKEMKDKLPGFSGKESSQAGVSIQYSFDIRNGEVTELSIGPAVTSDIKHASENRSGIIKGDMYLRDLGYYSTELLSYIDMQEAYYCSRLNSKVNVYQKQNDEYVLLSFSDLYAQMKKKQILRLELDVYVGKKEKMPTRLIVELMPEEEYSKRLRKIDNYNKHNGHATSQEHKDRIKLNLFITNVPSSVLSPEQVHLLYKLRWQIELRFKIWKSIFVLDKLPKMKYDRYLCTLYAKLLMVFIFYELTINIDAMLYKKTGKKLSINKCFKTLKLYSLKILKMLVKNINQIKQIIETFTEIFKERHWIESKKNKVGFNEIFNVFI